MKDHIKHEFKEARKFLIDTGEFSKRTIDKFMSTREVIAEAKKTKERMSTSKFFSS